MITMSGASSGRGRKPALEPDGPGAPPSQPSPATPVVRSDPASARRSEREAPGAQAATNSATTSAIVAMTAAALPSAGWRPCGRNDGDAFTALQPTACAREGGVSRRVTSLGRVLDHVLDHVLDVAGRSPPAFNDPHRHDAPAGALRRRATPPRVRGAAP